MDEETTTSVPGSHAMLGTEPAIRKHAIRGSGCSTAGQKSTRGPRREGRAGARTL